MTEIFRQPAHARQWRMWRQWRRSELPPTLRGWLLDPASLTERLQIRCPGAFRVAVAWQGWAKPQRNECRALGLRRCNLALIREVHLLCDDTPWVFARTVIPRVTLRGRERRLAWLGSRPLGAVLFADPRMRRGAVEIARVMPETDLYRRALAGSAAADEPLWGRRSVFTLGRRKSLLVSEFFLPALEDRPARQEAR